MIERFGRPWTWLVDGTCELIGLGLERLARRAAIRVEVGDDAAVLRAPDGRSLGRLVGEPDAPRLDPPEAIAALKGAVVALAVPPGWVFRRKLDPVAAQGAPFIDAYVRHQIDRVTPWRAEDVFFCVRHQPRPGDASRIDVELVAVPRRRAGPLLKALQAGAPSRLSLVVGAPEAGDRAEIPVAGVGGQAVSRHRPMVALGLACFLLAGPAALAWVFWSAGTIEDEIVEADRVMDERKTVLAAAERHDRAAAGSREALQRLRASHPRMVDLLEDLSAALPNSAYVTDLAVDKEHVRISGVSTSPSQIVPALEASGHFADAASFDATTRVEDGRGDRFHIEMRVRAEAEAAR